jgi:molecular chaperone GrpE
MNEEERVQQQGTEPEENLAPGAQEPHQEIEVVETSALQQMEERLTEAAKKAEENWDRFVRAQAELENVRRRAEKDLQSAHKFALERFAKDLLAVVDSLELGLQAEPGDSAGAMREGMNLTLKQLLGVLERFDIKPVDPLGERFNPELHQAMLTEASAEAEPNSVVRVFQKGYLLHDRLLRPAMVVVAQPLPEAAGIGGKP